MPDPQDHDTAQDGKPSGRVAYLVPIGTPVYVAFPGVWKCTRTPSGGHLMELLEQDEADDA